MSYRLCSADLSDWFSLQLLQASWQRVLGKHRAYDAWFSPTGAANNEQKEHQGDGEWGRDKAKTTSRLIKY